MKRALFAILFALSASVSAGMPIFTQTYDLDPVLCEGLYLDGVTYSFSESGVPSLLCLAGFFGPGTTNNIDDPSIEGVASGILHLTFDVPTTKFGFGVAMSTGGSISDAVTVSLYRPGAGILRDTIFLGTTPDPDFTGGRYDYNGPAVKTVTIEFTPSAGRFAVDNVYYFRPPGQMD